MQVGGPLHPRTRLSSFSAQGSLLASLTRLFVYRRLNFKFLRDVGHELRTDHQRPPLAAMHSKEYILLLLLDGRTGSLGPSRGCQTAPLFVIMFDELRATKKSFAACEVRRVHLVVFDELLDGAKDEAVF